MQSLLGRQTLRLAALLVALATLLSFIIFLSVDVKNRLKSLEVATSDNGQWAITQSEVEALKLRLALAKLTASPQDPLAVAEVHRWFDVLYSRLNILQTSRLYASLKQVPANRERLDKMAAILASWLPEIDGTEQALIEAAPRLSDEAEQLHVISRDLTLSVLKDVSQQGDNNREQMAETLISLALAATALVLLLAVLSVVLSQQYRLTRKQAEINHVTGSRLQVIIANSPDAIVVANRGGWAVEFNPAAESMFGLTREQVVGNLVIPMLFARDHAETYQQQIAAWVEKSIHEGAQRFELEAQRNDGTRFPVEISVASRNLAKGTLIVGFIRDISTRKANEAALQVALEKAQAGEKAKADFLAVVSHEMRTPLNGLLGSLELIRSTKLNADQEKLLSVVETSGNVLLGHVNSVLDIARAEADDIRIVDEPFDLDKLIADCIDNQTSLALRNGTTLSHRPLTGPFGEVRGDAGRVRQILLNLIGNAVKFTHGGKITLETERLDPKAAKGRPGLVEFRVIDTGIGIAEENLGRIFDDFETVDSSYGRLPGGTGLGLGIVKRLTQAMSGSIGVESELGDGSVFWVRLPLRPSRPLLKAIATESSAEGPKTAYKPPSLDVLVIEDNDINRFLVRRFLEEADHLVTEAVDGVDGVLAAEKKRYDVILTDISMPRMDGVEATQRIRSGNGPSSKSRIIALTAHALPEDLRRFTEAGINLCLTKPISREVLMSHLHGTVDPTGRPQGAENQPILDPVPLQELIDELGLDLLQNLVTRLIGEAESTIAVIAASISPNEDMARMAHQLAGGCATFGTKRLREVLAKVETCIKTDDAEGALTAAAALPEIWIQTKAALEAEVKRLTA